jgi:hypothetical protein
LESDVAARSKVRKKKKKKKKKCKMFLEILKSAPAEARKRKLSLYFSLKGKTDIFFSNELRGSLELGVQSGDALIAIEHGALRLVVVALRAQIGRLFRLFHLVRVRQRLLRTPLAALHHVAADDRQRLHRVFLSAQ